MWFSVGIAALTGVAFIASDGPSAADITRHMRQKLEKVNALSADFSIIARLAPMEQVRELSGRLLLMKKQNKVRLEQSDQTVVSDGKSVWTYIPANKQIIVTPMEQATVGMRPDEFLFYYTERYTHTLIGQETVDGVPLYALKLTANDALAPLPEIHLWVDGRQWLTRKVVYRDEAGSETTIWFSNIRLNPALSSDAFTMAIPEGVEVVDLR
jgi:chaperone LolA